MYGTRKEHEDIYSFAFGSHVNCVVHEPWLIYKKLKAELFS